MVSVRLSHTIAIAMMEEDSFVRKLRAIKIGKRFSILSKLGGGTFGAVYMGTSVYISADAPVNDDVGTDFDSGLDVAIKLEHQTAWPSMLQNEKKVYHDLAGMVGLPRVYYDGLECDFRVLIMDLLGPSLADLQRYCGNKFSMKTTCMLARQLIILLEHLHSRGYVHRDIKPDNFLIGAGVDRDTVYMSDLGMACEMDSGPWLRDDQERQPALMGTPEFASITGHYNGCTIMTCSFEYWTDAESFQHRLHGTISKPWATC